MLTRKRIAELRRKVTSAYHQRFLQRNKNIVASQGRLVWETLLYRIQVDRYAYDSSLCINNEPLCVGGILRGECPRYAALHLVGYGVLSRNDVVEWKAVLV